MVDAKVKVSLTDGTLELEGSETFVSEQLGKFHEVIQEALRAGGQRKPARNTEHNMHVATNKDAAPGTDANESGNLADIFALTDAGVQILKPIPGSSGAEKMVNVAQLLSYGMKTLKGKDTILFEDVKAACKSHGCYDSKNMATKLKDEKELFVVGGAGKKQNLTLTVPGIAAAKQLIAELRGEAAQG